MNAIAQQLRTVSEKLHGMGWVAASTWGVQAIRLLTLAILSNYLPPITFGVFAFALAIVTIGQPIAGLGLSSAIVFRPDLDRQDVSSAIAAAAVSGGLAMLVLLLLVAIHPFNVAPSQNVLLAILVSGIFFTNIANVTVAVPRREKRFAVLATIALVSELVGSALGIAIAVSGGELESLVFRYFLTSAAMAWLGLVVVRSQITMPSFEKAKALVREGLPISGSETLANIRERGDELLIGALMGAAPLGIYSIARRYVGALKAAIPAVVNNHASPVLASLRDDTAGLANQARRSLTLVTAGAWPAFVALGVLASVWVPLLMGDSWLAAIPVIAVLSGIAAIRGAVELPLVALVSLAHTGTRLRLELFLGGATLLGILIGAQYGIPGLLWGLVAANLLIVPYELWTAQRMLPIDLNAFARTVGIAAAANIALILFLTQIVDIAGPVIGPVMTIAFSLAFAVLVALALMLRRQSAPAAN